MESLTLETCEEVRSDVKPRLVLSRRSRPPATKKECPVCLGQHDNEIHSATVNVLEWFRFEVTRYFV